MLRTRTRTRHSKTAPSAILPRLELMRRRLCSSWRGMRAAPAPSASRSTFTTAIFIVLLGVEPLAPSHAGAARSNDAVHLLRLMRPCHQGSVHRSPHFPTKAEFRRATQAPAQDCVSMFDWVEVQLIGLPCVMRHTSMRFVVFDMEALAHSLAAL